MLKQISLGSSSFGLPARAVGRGIILRLRTIADARLTHFLLLSLILFAWDWDARTTGPSERVVWLSKLDMALQSERVAAKFPQAPAAQMGKQALAERYVEDAVLVAEARRLGLDQDDEIIRSRLVQKMLFLAEELGGASRTPSDAELRAYFDEHRAAFTRPARVRFRHVFARSVDAAQQLLDDVVRFDADHPDTQDPPPFGHPFAAPRRVELRPEDVTRKYGPDFAQVLADAPLETWFGPVRSRYGAHLVHISARDDALPATYEEVKAEVPLRLLLTRRDTAVHGYLTELLRRYEVRLDGEPVTAHVPAPRHAIRAAASAED